MRKANLIMCSFLAVLIAGCTASREAEFEDRVAMSVRATVQVMAAQLVPAATPEATSNEASNAEAKATPTLGLDRQHPIPLGTVAAVPASGGMFSLRISQIVRGGDALLLMKQANSGFMSSSDPGDGLEWMLVRFTGKCLSDQGDKGSYFGNTDYWKVYSRGRAVSQMTLLGTSAPKPELFEQYIAGADVDGWVALQVHPDETKPLLFVPFNSMATSDGIWFALSE